MTFSSVWLNSNSIHLKSHNWMIMSLTHLNSSLSWYIPKGFRYSILQNSWMPSANQHDKFLSILIVWPWQGYTLWALCNSLCVCIPIPWWLFFSSLSDVGTMNKTVRVEKLKTLKWNNKTVDARILQDSGNNMDWERRGTAGAERHVKYSAWANSLTPSEFLLKMSITNGIQDSLDIVCGTSLY